MDENRVRTCQQPENHEESMFPNESATRHPLVHNRWESVCGPSEINGSIDAVKNGAPDTLEPQTRISSGCYEQLPSSKMLESWNLFGV